MAEIVEVDKSGRIVIPKRLRDELGIRERTRLILMKRNGKIIVTPLDVDEIARRLEKELEGIEVEDIAASIRREINAKIAKEHPELSTG
ncbi:MAG: AbrB/MazE/SpoVT family DNA-binding domain-containing protein [Deltaproteobacteria bacterium]|nr:AbrB/MazE/SpoVT family DNA-binding domain-containing protein [Deltaproteobacteria bacterium]